MASKSDSARRRHIGLTTNASNATLLDHDDEVDIIAFNQGHSEQPLLYQNKHGMTDVQIQSIPFWSRCLSIWPLLWCNSCYTLEPRQEALVFHYGSLTDLKRSPGIHFALPAGLKVQRISTKQRTHSLPDCKITDKSGNPIICSAVINFRVVDGKQALLNVQVPCNLLDDFFLSSSQLFNDGCVQNVDIFVKTNATAVLKQIVSQHTYEELKSEAAELNALMRSSLQQRTRVGGVNVGSMEINELNYAPEIAAGMLKKQQAQALIAARHVIVAGATEIAKAAIKSLEEGEEGMKLSASDKAKIVTNLLTVTCSDSDAVPTVSMF